MIVFFMGYYINYIGDTYDMHTSIFGLSYDDIEVQMKTSRDDVVVLSDYEVDENGELELHTTAREGDMMYDDIGSGLEVKRLREEKRDLLEALEMYVKVFFLGLEGDEDDGETEE